MARATNKADLTKAAESRFRKLWELVGSMSTEEQEAGFLFEDRDKNIRDVLIHLYEWHRMMAAWHRIGTLEGGRPEVPGRGYTWRTLPDLNREIWRKYQNVSLGEAKTKLKASHKKILALIESRTDEELFSKGVYQWTRGSTLGSYFVSSTASHYDWAMRAIKKHINSYRAARI